MEQNKIFQGEKLAFVGVLKVDGVVKNDYSMSYQVITLGGKVSEEYPVSLDGNTYYGEVDTSGLLGQVMIRIIVRDNLENKVVSNQNLNLNIFK